MVRDPWSNVKLTTFGYSIHNQSERLSYTYNDVQTGRKSVDGVKNEKNGGATGESDGLSEAGKVQPKPHRG